jgi:polyphosphate kinase 2 (PPK2 family)
MLDKIDLNLKLDKQTYKERMPELQDRLYTVQKASWDSGTPVILIFEGWDAAGKGTGIQSLTSPLDPRGFKLYPIRAARTYEKKRPWLWRFWLKLPNRGEWAIFDRSWYGRVLVERVENLTPEAEWRRAYRDIVDFERALADDGAVIIKFFLHISKAEQKRRFEKLLKDSLNAWHVSAEDWEHHRRYDDWVFAYEEMFERTDTEWGPWTIVEATDRRFTRAKIFQTIINALEPRLGLSPAAASQTLRRHSDGAPLSVETAAELAEAAGMPLPSPAELPASDAVPVSAAIGQAVRAPIGYVLPGQSSAQTGLELDDEAADGPDDEPEDSPAEEGV